jgi:hypothetical protein
MSQPTVQFDEFGVRLEIGNGKAEQVAWDALLEVVILTTRDGPFAEDLFFVLTGRGGARCVVPLSATKGNGLLARLQKLPGFDNEAFSQAMKSTAKETVVCWRR